MALSGVNLVKGRGIWLLALGAASLAAFVAWTCPLLTTDTCSRYAPMAEAFASGEWALAFHPRFCLGMPSVAGTFRYLTGVDGYTACAVVSSVAWALAVLPLFALARRIFDERTAWFAAILYLVSPTIVIWGLKGLREPFKVLGLLLMVDAVFGCRAGGWRNFAEASAGLALLLFFKVDSVLFGFLLSYIYMRVDGFHRRSWLLLGEMLVLLQPCCLLVCKWTGVWVPVFQYAGIWNKVVGG